MNASVIIVETDCSPLVLQEITNDLQQYKQKPALTAPTEQHPNGKLDTSVRNCTTASLPTSKWYAGMLWHHISRVNQQLFHYDITCFDKDLITYISYTDQQYYNWHTDVNPPTNNTYRRPQENSPVQHTNNYQRKLSFSFILSNNYTGGELQVKDIADNITSYTPKQGQLLIFDSRLKHRVTPIQSGRRDVLVGWAIGPQWR